MEIEASIIDMDVVGRWSSVPHEEMVRGRGV